MAPVHRSAVTKARAKIPWELFRDIFHHAVGLAYDLRGDVGETGWHGKDVFAIDGSQHSLPSSPGIRNAFDSNSGTAVRNRNHGYYPQCLVSTAYDVYRKLPVARAVAPIKRSERAQASEMLARIPSGGILLMDRGYPSYGLLRELQRNYDGWFLMRAPAKSTFPSVMKFIEDGKEDAQIAIDPSCDYIQANKDLKGQLEPVTVRCIKMVSPDGEVSVLLTNLNSWRRFSAEELVKLYQKRWAIEVGYRDEKQTLQIERFHSKTVNGIMQEFYAMLTLCVISRMLMELSGTHKTQKSIARPQFSNAIKVTAKYAAILVSDTLALAAATFDKVLRLISSVRYYKPKKPRKSYPRINKGAKNKWKNLRGEYNRNRKR